MSSVTNYLPRWNDFNNTLQLVDWNNISLYRNISTYVAKQRLDYSICYINREYKYSNGIYRGKLLPIKLSPDYSAGVIFYNRESL